MGAKVQPRDAFLPHRHCAVCTDPTKPIAPEGVCRKASVASRHGSGFGGGIRACLVAFASPFNLPLSDPKASSQKFHAAGENQMNMPRSIRIATPQQDDAIRNKNSTWLFSAEPASEIWGPQPTAPHCPFRERWVAGPVNPPRSRALQRARKEVAWGIHSDPVVKTTPSEP